jgi:hypothetical protein
MVKKPPLRNLLLFFNNLGLQHLLQSSLQHVSSEPVNFLSSSSCTQIQIWKLVAQLCRWYLAFLCLRYPFNREIWQCATSKYDTNMGNVMNKNYQFESNWGTQTPKRWNFCVRPIGDHALFVFLPHLHFISGIAKEGMIADRTDTKISPFWCLCASIWFKLIIFVHHITHICIILTCSTLPNLSVEWVSETQKS